MAESLAPLQAALADRYTVERELGQGGMATVYLARDHKHDRKVAIKVLKPKLAAVLGADRFVQEITTTAQLQHPHILPLFDSGSADGFLYYVMPYIEGETLRNKLDREHQLGIDEAVKITTEVADALDYAHRHGVIHRDIKPENILLHDGRPMVADFGIALAVSAAAGGRMTETGLSLGTPHYMSPEQATAEKDITARSDVYSLASVLYEMLAGQPPHLGGTAQQIIMKIIAEPVPMVTTFRKSVPPNVAAALVKALEKLPADRFATAKTFAEALTNPAFTTASTLAGAPAPRLRSWPTARTAAALVILGALAAWGWFRPRATRPGQAMVEFYLDDAGDSTLSLDWPAFSPDGRRVVAHATTSQGEMLYQRALDARDWRPIPGTEGASNNSCFSPDGRWVGFTTHDGEIKRIPVEGVGAQTITQIRGSTYGVSWSPDNTVVFSVDASDPPGQQVLFRVRADGGTPERLPALQGVPGRHVMPHVSSDGEVLFFEIIEAGRPSLGALSLRSGKVSRLGPGMSPLTDRRGRVVYVTADSLAMVQSFNARTLTLEGSPRRIAEGLGLFLGIAAEYTIAPDGTLVFSTGTTRGTDLMLVDRTGRGRKLLSGSPILMPRFSPSGERIAFIRKDRSQASDLWVYSLVDGTAQRLTSMGDVTDPAWSHDSRWIGFSAWRRAGDRANLFRIASDGTGSVQPLLTGQADFWQMSFGRGDREVVFWSDNQLLRATIESDSAPVSLVRTDAALGNPALSTDSRWLAYSSNETGTTEIYAQSYPDPGPRTVVSVGGGRYPVWSADGREIYYWGSSQLMTAAVRFEASRVTIVQRTQLLDIKSFRTELLRNYDVRPSGREFVVLGGTAPSRLVARIGALDEEP